MTFRRRNYPEVLDNLLTGITDGVAAESHPFPPGGANPAIHEHQLQQPPVAEVIGVYGSRSGQPHTFRKETDFELLPNEQTLKWKDGAELPDPGTLIFVNYYPKSSQPILTDIQTGSVVRTLCETIALEFARLYAQLDAVYDSSFIDTATNRSLENVVALLGVERIKGGRPTGQIEFTRTPGTRGVVTIPAGTRISIAGGDVEYETTESITLSDGQNTIRVIARDLEPNDPVPANTLTVLPIPISGISNVSNPGPTSISTVDESDDALRTRAKNFLHGSERATLASLRHALARQGITADIRELPDQPGVIEYTPHAESMPPELQQRMLKAIDDARPAGVVVRPTGVIPPRKINLTIRLHTKSDLLEQDLRAVQRNLRDSMTKFFAEIPIEQDASLNQIVGLVLAFPEVNDVSILDAVTADDNTNVLNLADGKLDIKNFPSKLGELNISDPNLPTRLNVVVTYPEADDPPDVSKIQAALHETIAYINELNATDAISTDQQQLTFGELLLTIPLPAPAKETGKLQTYHQLVDDGGSPVLPTVESVLPYESQFIFSQESGLSLILVSASDAYSLTGFERLSLAGVEIQPRA